MSKKLLGSHFIQKNLMAWRGLDSIHFERWKTCPTAFEGKKNPWKSKEGPKECMSREQM
jgi:hypothetical protein